MGRDGSLPVIVIAFANDRGDSERYLRNLPEEHRRLREILRTAAERGLCEFVEIANATAEDIFRVFQSPQYRGRVAVFHYGGHAGGYELLLETSSGSAAAANAAGLAEFLGQQNSLQLVFLNGCSTEQQSEGLLNAGVNAVISTSTAINDQVATELAVRFYRSLAGGADLGTAFKEATAAARTEAGQSTRALYLDGGAESRVICDRLPWEIYFRSGAELIADWNLPNAVENPLFGLPPLKEQDLEPSPFRHLKWFRRRDAEVFFGRGNEIRDLYQKATSEATAPIILFYGQSGVGKSSVLDAGLIPRLESSQTVRYLRRDQLQGLASTLRLAFLPEGADLAANQAWHARESAVGQPMTVVLDQVEEVYTRPCGAPSEELNQFLDAVRAIFRDRAGRPRGRLILGFRKEWLAEIKRHLGEYQLPYTEVFLERLSRRGVHEAITGPTRVERLQNRYQLEIESGLAEQIADDLLDDAGGAVAPTLQVLLSRMWEAAAKRSSAKPKFTRELYSNMRREGVLLRDFLSRQLKYVEQRWPNIVSPDLLLDLLSIHTTRLGTAEQRALAELEQTYSHHASTLREILDGCKDAFLLTMPVSDVEEEEHVTRLVHDTLAPLVRERYEQSDHPGQRARRILENRIIEWEGGKIGALLDDRDLSIVEAGRNGMRAWTGDELRLVEASRVEFRRRRRTRRFLEIMCLLGVAAAVGATWLIWAGRKIADRTRQESAQSYVQRLHDDGNQALEREFSALWELATKGSDEEGDLIRAEVLTVALANPELALRLAHQSEGVTRAVLGLNLKKREAALQSIQDAIAPPRPEELVDWRVACACAELANALQPIDDELGRQIASVVVAQMRARRDPHELGELATSLGHLVEGALATDGTLRYLDPDRAKQAIHALLEPDLNVSARHYPETCSFGIEVLARHVHARDAAGLQRSADKLRSQIVTGDKGFDAAIQALSPRELGDAGMQTDVPDISAVTAVFLESRVLPVWRIARGASPDEKARRIENSRKGLLSSLLEIARPPLEPGEKSLRQRTHALAAIVDLVAQTPDEFPDEMAMTIRVIQEEMLSRIDDANEELSKRFNELKSERAKPASFGGRILNSRVKDLISSAADAAAESDVLDRKFRSDVREAQQVLTTRVSAALDVLAMCAKLDRETKSNQPPDREQAAATGGADRKAATETNFSDANIVDSIVNAWDLLEDMQQSMIASYPSPADENAAASSDGTPFDLSTYLSDMSAGMKQQGMLAESVSCLPWTQSREISELTMRVVTAMKPGNVRAEARDVYEDLIAEEAKHFAKLLIAHPDDVPAEDQETATLKFREWFEETFIDFQVLPTRTQLDHYSNCFDALSGDLKINLAARCNDQLKVETSHARIGALAILLTKLDSRPAVVHRREVLRQLCGKLYRLPPSSVVSNRPEIQAMPTLLAQGISSLARNADPEDQVLSAHVLMHAILLKDYARESGLSLRAALAEVMRTSEPTMLVELLKAPSCLGDSRTIVLDEIERRSGVSLNDSVWSVALNWERIQSAKNMPGLDATDLEAHPRFPTELKLSTKKGAPK